VLFLFPNDTLTYRELAQLHKKQKLSFRHAVSERNHLFENLRTLHDSWYRGVDKSLARLTSRCILFDGENISFDTCLVRYINSNIIPPIMIIKRIYETPNLLSP